METLKNWKCTHIGAKFDKTKHKSSAKHNDTCAFPLSVFRQHQHTAALHKYTVVAPLQSYQALPNRGKYKLVSVKLHRKLLSFSSLPSLRHEYLSTPSLIEDFTEKTFLV